MESSRSLQQLLETVQIAYSICLACVSPLVLFYKKLPISFYFKNEIPPTSQLALTTAQGSPTAAEVFSSCPVPGE